MTESNGRLRLSVIGVIVMALFSGLLVRLWFLQVTDAESFVARTKANKTRLVVEPGARGTIRDRQGRIIVENAVVNSVRIRRGTSETELEIAITNLAKTLGIKEKTLRSRTEDPRLTAYEPIPVMDGVDYETLVYIKERPEQFPGIIATRRTVRVYPYGAIAAHLLGYVGSVSAEDIQLNESENYTGEDVIGKEGVERVFESELRGQPRVRRLEVDSAGRLVRVVSDTPAKAGNDVQLTMDLDIQRIAEESLRQGVEQVREIRDVNVRERFATYDGTGAATVVLDARDGSVVAMASYPTFDPIKLSQGLSAEEYRALTSDVSNNPLLNRATSGAYPPGSTWKLFTSIAALENKQVTPQFTLNDQGCIAYEEREFCNARDSKYGIVNLASALTVSSDVYFYNLGFKFWKTWYSKNDDNKSDGAARQIRRRGNGIQRTARAYGFGASSNSGLPNEQAGRVPDQRWKKKFIEQLNGPEQDQQWFPGDSANLSIGQGDLLVTPLQLATGYAAFLNGGTVYSPRLAEAILGPGGEETLRELPAQPINTTGLDPEVRGAIMSGLIGAVTAGNGTATAAFGGYTSGQLAGKTGTSESINKQDNALFVGMVNPNPPPDTNTPQYVVAVVVEQGGFGGATAAPIARRIIDALFGNLNPRGVTVRQPRGGD